MRRSRHVGIFAPPRAPRYRRTDASAVRFEHTRYLGDKRTQLVYDLDEWDDEAVIDEIIAAETGLCFGPTRWPRRATGATRWPSRGCAGGSASRGPEPRPR